MERKGVVEEQIDGRMQNQFNIPLARGPEIVSVSDVNITLLTLHRLPNKAPDTETDQTRQLQSTLN